MTGKPIVYTIYYIGYIYVYIYIFTWSSAIPTGAITREAVSAAVELNLRIVLLDLCRNVFGPERR